MNKLRKKENENTKQRNPNLIARFFAWVMTGNILTREKIVSQLPMLILLMVVSLIYISNIYSTEKLIRSINKLEKGNKELYYKHINLESKLMKEYFRQTEVAKKLKGTGVKESVIPPQKIYSAQK